MQWTELSAETREIMDELGGFSPTVKVQQKEVKGYTRDMDTGEPHKTYWSPKHLRKIATACQEVACFLESRAIDSGEEMIPKGVKFLNNWISIGRAIEFLTNEETNSVTFYNANPDFNGPNYKISCSGEWTGWQDIDFLGESLIECLEEAVEKKQSIPVIWKAEK